LTCTALVIVICWGLYVARSEAARSPASITEKNSAVLLWLAGHPRPGNAHSRAVVTSRAKAKVWWGLRLAGVAWLDRRRGDVDPASPFGCVHSKEADWRDTGDPHWGGLQMDRGFMDTYATDYQRAFHGLANVWPIWAQVVAAYRAHRGVDWRGDTWPGPRGFTPWPNTGRACGLL
jgi:hypothetical protein